MQLEEEEGLLVRLTRLSGEEQNQQMNENHKVALEIKEYFQGNRRYFDTPYRLEGAASEMVVYHALRTIPYGKTISYTELARLVGRPKAHRWVASVCARNPLPILIPCHRVVRKDGSLGGYNLGLSLKEKLLELEKTYDQTNS